MMERSLVQRLTDCQSELQKIKSSQAIDTDNYHIYTYTGSASTNTYWGAGGEIVFTGENAFPLVCLQNITFYINGTAASYVGNLFYWTNGAYLYLLADDTAIWVTVSLPQGTEESNQHKFTISVSAPNWSTQTNLRFECVLRTNCKGEITTDLSGYTYDD